MISFFSFFGFCFVFVVFVFIFFLFFCCLLVLICLFFLITQSQAAFLNCLYIARFTIVHSKTQIKFPLFFLLLLLLLLVLNWGEHHTLNWWNPSVEHLWFLWKKKKRFSSRPWTKVSHQVLPEHSLDIYIPDFIVLQPALRHFLCHCLFLIYRKMDDSGYVADKSLDKSLR